MKSLVVLFACILLFVHSAEASLPGVNDTDRFKFQKDDPILSQMDSLDVVNFFKRHTFTADVNKLNIYNYAKDSVPMFSDDVYRQRLQKLDKQSPFALDYNNDVRKYIELYAVKRRGTAQRMLGLAELYFPLFEEVLSKYNMPLELKYLAIVESALNPTIKSKAGAMGLWQFMYGTGKLYGLQINSYIDERCDPIKSTEAAARYLKYLYKYYNNDWQLALAVNYVMAHHKEHNIYPQKPKYFYYELDSIYIKQHLSFKQVSDYLKIPIEELRILNPAFIKDEIPETENGYPLFLPKNLIGDFIANQDLIMKKSEPVVSIETPVKKDTVTTTTTPSNNTGAANEVVYKVQKGDWLSNIAKKFNVSVQQIKDWNKLSSETLYVGQILKIQSSNETNTTVNSTNTTSPPKQSGSTKYHTIRSGDTLWGLAQKYNTSIDNLRKWNNLYSGKSIHIGMKIIVSKG
jgi:membrane-bound lytic murein transglycosylase D